MVMSMLPSALTASVFSAFLTVERIGGHARVDRDRAGDDRGGRPADDVGVRLDAEVR